MKEESEYVPVSKLNEFLDSQDDRTAAPPSNAEAVAGLAGWLQNMSAGTDTASLYIELAHGQYHVILGVQLTTEGELTGHGSAATIHEAAVQANAQLLTKLFTKAKEQEVSNG